MSHRTPDRFDAAFYRQFYVNPRTRVTTRREMTHRASAVAACVQRLRLPVRRILDAGCGLGLMRRSLLRVFPGARYIGLEVSEHLCARYGWTRGSLADFSPRGRFDLIVCYDVLQYLHDREAARAIGRLAKLCRGALYFHAPTLEDWHDNADTSCSDSDIRLRAAQWYRARLSRHFEHLGFGIHISRDAEVALWELERPGND